MASAIELLLLAQYTARPPVAALGTGTGSTVTAAAMTNLSPAFTVPAYDATAGVAYRLTCWGHGTQGSTPQGITFQVLTGATASATATWSSGFCGASTGFAWTFKADVLIKTAGSSGTFTSGQYNIVNQTNIAAAGNTPSGALNTTASWAYVIQAQWASTTGAPTITCDGGYLERIA